MKATFVAVYRKRNERIVRRLIDRAGCALDVRLWALDAVAPSLEVETIGVGPGGKFELVNRLLADATGDTIVSDDDVTMRRGGLARMLRVMEAWQIDLAQPAHTRRSHATHQITRRQVLNRARRTSFVEIGPIYAVAARALPDFVPFDDAGMGWGIEVDWAEREREGRRLAIIDAVPMRHLVPPGVAYDMQVEMRRLTERLARLGAGDISGIQHERDRWRRWQRTPPA